jgi:hypothetical protein
MSRDLQSALECWDTEMFTRNDLVSVFSLSPADTAEFDRLTTAGKLNHRELEPTAVMGRLARCMAGK